ncbi:MAG TPA: hypothetical protein VGP64_15660 [Polyangia bacterium]
MNRLRDEVGQGAIHEKGIDLIRRTPGTPSDAELKRRVWTAVKDGEPRGSRARHWVPVRSFAVAGVILLVGGSAAAMIGYGRHWVWPRTAAPTPPAVAPPPRASARAALPAPALPAIAMERTAPAAAPIPSTRPRPVHATPQHTIELTPAAAATAERTQVLDAMIALRHDHDAARAAHLLDHYLVTHPRGVLREEALALAIEAATARSDGPTARRLAASYLEGYPRGRFRDFARDTLGAGTP